MSTAVQELGRRAREASRVLATASTAVKDDALLAAADLLVDRSSELLDANAADVEAAQADGMEPAPLDRLRLTGARIEAMATGLRQV
ncbi:MAG: gamma-glutamyl-phosphate reductase, partial [Acidimicrobiia bacterium]|nr:gamma-glutamyl-phosphate reductase [Acidimicrobiia bacterium]